MWLQAYDVLTPQEYSLVFYLCAAVVMGICFAIAFKHMSKYDGD
jgi:hypothetical protein